MKRILFVFFSLLFTVSFAQNGKKQHYTPTQKADKVVKTIDSIAVLSPDQKKKIHDIVKIKVEKSRTIRRNASLSKEEKKVQLQPIRQEARKSIAKVLDDQQRTKWQAYKKEKRQARKTKIE